MLRLWLFGIAYRVMLDFKRKHQNRFEEPTEQIESIDSRPGADELFARRQGLA